jgi:electron transfer flavoprotein alpha subunit
VSQILIIAEHDGATLNPGTAKCVTCARAITGTGGGSVDLLVLAADAAPIAEQAATLEGVDRVLAVSGTHLATPLAVNWAPEVAALAGNYTHLLGPSSTFGKDLMPRIAALLGVNQVSDVMAVEGTHAFKRPIYAGNAIIDVRAPEDATVVATVRNASWKAAAESTDVAAVEAREATGAAASHTRFLGLKTGDAERPDLQTAGVVVSGGRALGSAEGFEIIYRFADRIGAAVGATRAAVDAGYVPNDMQVGQTGKIIAPELYFAFGISGAIQHVTGIKDAGTIVAVNKDADAPIFEIADIGLVGDLFTVLPELERQL